MKAEDALLAIENALNGNEGHKLATINKIIQGWRKGLTMTDRDIELFHNPLAETPDEFIARQRRSERIREAGK